MSLAVSRTAPQAEVRQLVQEVADHLHLDPPPIVHNAVAFAGVLPADLYLALDEASPGWKERGLVYLPPD